MAKDSESFSSESDGSGGAQPVSRYFRSLPKKGDTDNHDDSQEYSPPSATPTPDSRISGASSEDDDHSITIMVSSKQYTKLELIDARKISALLRWFAAGMALGAAVSILLLILSHTKYRVKLEGPDGFDPSKVYVVTVGCIRIAFFLLLLIMLVFYSIRIGRLSKSERTHQQLWVIMLLFSSACYLNPYWDILQLCSLGAGLNLLTREWVGAKFTDTLFDFLKPVSFSIMTLFYIWASVHSYGLLKVKLGPRFYLTKGLLILGYSIFQAVLYLRYDIRVADLPLASIISVIVFFKFYDLPEFPNRDIPRYIAVSVSLMTVYEVFLLALIIRRIITTKRTLAKVDYLRYRTKQIGFRFFLYNSINFYIIFWLFYVITLVGPPPGLRNRASIVVPQDDRVLTLDLLRNTAGLEILIVVYAGLESYLNLPADAVGFRGWIRPQAKARNIKAAPITYKKLEPGASGKNPLDFQSNCFVMQTHVEMFNFSWLVYYHGTPKYAGLQQSPGLFSYRIEGYAHDNDTDTHALVIDGSDRIVVAFRGTSSARNLRTDLKAFHMPCSKVVPTRLEEGDFQTDDPLVQKTVESKEFGSAKFHKGFALAYMSISKSVMKMIKDLYDKQERPVYLTGHSLGGALAAIASFDLYLKLGLESNELFVSSFGAPRVGNMSFRKMYDKRIPNHWRIVIQPDIVTRLPKVGYQHVGKKVMLTAAGELFIDPNSLEMKHWHGDPTSILYHRKASYLLAMKAWCRKHHRETYEPHFWPFPYTVEDSRRFPDGAPTRQYSTSYRREGGHRRIMMLDAMVDALDRKQKTDVSEYALSNWTRLVRRALLNETFRLRLNDPL